MTGLTLHQAPPEDLSAQWLEGLSTRFGTGGKVDPVSACLSVILEALEWQGLARRLVEAAPSQDRPLDFEDMRETLARLGFATVPLEERRSRITNGLCPLLLVKPNGVPVVGLSRDKNGFIYYDGDQPTRTQTAKRLPHGQIFVVERAREADAAVPDTPGAWLRQTMGRFKQVIITSLAVSLAINLLSLVVPLGIMAIYDQVIAKGGVELLPFIILGVVGAALFEISLRVLRAKVQAYAGARLDFLVSTDVFQQILYLPPMFTERAPVGGQVTRVREFEAFRDLFGGAMASLALDLPFVLLFVAVIGVIAGPMALIPVILAGLYLVLAMVVIPALKERLKRAGAARTKRHAFMVEMMWWMRSSKELGLENTWRERFRELSADAAEGNYRAGKLNSAGQDASQTLMVVAGSATLVIGVLRAMDGAMTLGALIATMMLVWRVLSPIQALFGLITRIDQTRQSIAQLLSMLAYEKEQQPGAAPTASIRFRGEVSFNRVSMRYTQDGNPAALGVTFRAAPGEIIGIIGDSGAGKSTIGKLAMGLYRPQGGSISLDGIDIRQLRPITLRKTLAYVPQRNHAFPGSILENLRLSDPTASVQEIEAACAKAGILHKIHALPHGLDTRFRDGLQAHVPQGFLRQLALARAFLRDAPVMVLDEPASSLEDEDEKVFLETLEKLRGNTTILMITQRPSHMRLCDKLLVMRHGQMDLFGTPDEVLSELGRRRDAARGLSEKGT